MPVIVGWDNAEQTVLLCQFIDPWGWEEYLKAFQRGWDMMGMVNHTVYVIADFSAGGAMPNGALVYFRNVYERIHPNRGSIVVVGANAFVRIILNALARSFRQAEGGGDQFVENIDQARTIIAQIQAQIE